MGTLLRLRVLASTSSGQPGTAGLPAGRNHTATPLAPTILPKMIACSASHPIRGCQGRTQMILPDIDDEPMDCPQPDSSAQPLGPCPLRTQPVAGSTLGGRAAGACAVRPSPPHHTVNSQWLNPLHLASSAESVGQNVEHHIATCSSEASCHAENRCMNQTHISAAGRRAAATRALGLEDRRRRSPRVTDSPARR